MASISSYIRYIISYGLRSTLPIRFDTCWTGSKTLYFRRECSSPVWGFDAEGSGRDNRSAECVIPGAALRRADDRGQCCPACSRSSGRPRARSARGMRGRTRRVSPEPLRLFPVLFPHRERPRDAGPDPPRVSGSVPAPAASRGVTPRAPRGLASPPAAAPPHPRPRGTVLALAEEFWDTGSAACPQTS